MFEGMRKRREEKRRRQEDVRNKLHAYALGREAGNRITDAVDAYLNTRLESAHSNGMGVLKERFNTVYDSPGYDPKVVAAVELRIFKEELDKLQDAIKSDIRIFLSETVDYAREAGVLELVDTYIERQIANTVEKMTNEGIALFEKVVAEVEAKPTKPQEEQYPS